jgi:endo-1,4-beta-xylanase
MKRVIGCFRKSGLRNTLKINDMKNYNPLINKIIICFLAFSLLGITYSPESNAQYKGIDDSIAKYRKGELIIHAKRGSQVTVEQLRHEFWFGCAIPNSLAGGMPQNNLRQFKEKFLENFNAGVTENALKWAIMEPRKDQENYAVIDTILGWTEKNHIPLRGHNLFWGIARSPNTGQQYVQQWVMELDDNELRQRIQERAERITKHYKGRFAEYDLNNEMIHGNYYEDRLGPEITKLMAQWALNGDPDAKLWVNDYDILITDSPLGIGLPEYMAHIRNLLKQGIPIAGIGVQGHSHLETFDRQVLRDALDSLAVFNLPIRITEFNMPGMRSEYRRSQLTPVQEEAKAKEIVDFYRICFAHPAVEGILMWGFWEGADWIPSSSLYKRDWTPTPAAEAYKDLIFNEWWTNVSGITDKKGLFSSTAFYGKYRVTVNGISKEIDLTREKGREIVDFMK